MVEGKSIGVVVPAHNEELLIMKVIETMPDFVDRIIVVDDCSEDRTREIVEKASAEREDVGLVCLPVNMICLDCITR